MKFPSYTPLFIVLTITSAKAITWDGSASGNWSAAANWDLNRVPNVLDQIIFPTAGANKLMNNDRPTAANGHAILTFSGSGYTLSGLPLNLIDPNAALAIVEATHTTGTTTLSAPMIVQEFTQFRATAAGTTLTLTSSADITAGLNNVEFNSTGLIDVNSTVTGTALVTVSGTGLVRFDAPQSMGDTRVTGQLMHTSTLAGDLFVLDPGILRGTGTISGNVSVSGDIEPGDTTTGRLTINGNLTFTAGVGTDAVFFDLVNATAATGHDQVRVGGTVVCEGAFITLRPASAFPLGTTFILIDKTSAGAITNSPSFSGISEGTIQVVGVNAFQFSYIGGNGNDFTATVVPAPLTTTRTWDGGSTVNQLWSSGVNWSTDLAPTAGHILNFGGAATTDVATVNDVGGNFSQLTFTGATGGFTISPSLLGGNPLTLNNGIAASQSGAACAVSNNLILAADQSYALTGTANLSISSGNSVALNGFNLTAHCAPTSGSPQLNLDAGISGTGGLLKTGPGRVQIGGIGTSSNAYTGTTTVQEGELRLTRTTIIAPANCIPGALVIGGGVNPASVTSSQAEKIADTAAVTVNANGSFLPGANETVGALTINGGIVNAGTNTLTINGPLTANSTTNIPAGAINFGGTPSFSVAAGTTLTLSPPILSSAAITKTGPGKVIINGVFSQPSFAIAAGIVEFNGDASQSGTFGLQAGGILSGEGVVESINASAGGIVQPLAASILTANTFTGGATAIFRPDISSSSTASSLNATVVNLGNMKLDPVLTTAPTVGEVFTIFSKSGATAIATRFTTMSGAALAENAILVLATGHFRISYSGGDGNDVTLTAVLPAASGVTRIWDGGDAGDAMRTALNWVGDIAPLPGDSLEFPATVHLAAINDFPVGMTFGTIRFTGVAPTTQARSLSGNAVQLLGGVTSSVTTGSSGASNLNLPVTFLSAATVTNTGTRTLTFQQAITTTLSPLRFAGAGDATQPLISLTFNSALSGPAQIRVEGNAFLNVSNSVSWTGGTVVERGNFTGPAVCAIGGLTVGLGTDIATAILSSQAQIFTNPIVVNSLGTLTFNSPCTLGPVTVNSGTILGSSTLTLASPVTLNGTAAFTAVDVAFSGGTQTLTAAPAASFTAATLGDANLANQNVLFNGGGTLRVNTLLATDALEISSSTFRQDGNIPSPTGTEGSVILNNGRLTGTGRVKSVNVAAVGGTIAPGASPGLLAINDGSTVLNPASALQIEINGPLPGTGYDRLISSSPNPQGAALQLTLSPTYTPLIGTEFILVQNLQPLGQPFASGFSGITEGSTALLAPGIAVSYSYLGGDGNDFAATVTASSAGSFRTWDGGGADANWMTAANWLGDVLPQPGESLLFPAGAAQLTNTNNFPATTTFHSLRLTAAYTLNTANVSLTGSLTANLAGTASVSGVKFLTDTTPNHTVQLEGSGSMTIPGTISLGTNVVLTLRRTDPAGTLPALAVASIMTDNSAAISSIIKIDGGGRVHFGSGSRSYSGGTQVLHGTLQIVAGSIPGDLAIGGGAGPAVVENPGASDASGGRISDLATLTLLPGGTHLMTGATPLERVSRIIYAGGQLSQPAGGRLRTFQTIEIPAGIDTTIDTPTFFDFPSNDTTDLLQVGAGGIARLTAPITSDFFQSVKLEKTGPGSVLINGGTISGTELRLTEGFLAPLGSGVTPIFMPVVLNGGTLGGNARISQSLTATSLGGTVAPGGGIDGRGPGALTIGDNLLLVPLAKVEIELGGAQNDQLIVTGATIDLNNSTLLLSRINGFTPTTGQTFTLLSKTSAGAITRTFSGKPQGNTFTAAGFNWTISYTGGDGNDIVLTAGAAAIAVDLKVTSFAITPPVGGGAGKRIQATISGGPGAANANVLLEISDDLLTWATLTTATADAAGNATFDTTDTLAGPRRFYRAAIQ